MLNNRMLYSFLFFLLLIFVYVIFPVPIYWTQYADLFRIILILYVIATSAIFYLIIGKSLDDKRFSPNNAIPWIVKTLKRREILLALLLIGSLKIYTIYANPVWLISDEIFHVHRGEVLLFSLGKNFNILPSNFDVNASMLEVWFNRYQPLSMVIEGISQAFFGGVNALPYIISDGLQGLRNHFILDNLAVRFPSLIFTLLTFIVVFKLAREYYDWRTSFFSATIIMLLPSHFMFTSSAHLASGVIFFTVFAAYFLIRFLKTEDIGYIILCALTVSVGALYKRPLIFFAVIIPIYLLFFTKIRNKIHVILTYSVIVAIATLPLYIMIQLFANYRSIGFVPNVTNLSLYLMALSLQMTLPLAYLSIIAIFVVGSKNQLSRFLVFWFVSWLLIFSLDTSVADRLTMPFIIPLSILSADLILSKLHLISRRLDQCMFKNVLIFIVLSFLLVESLLVFHGTDDFRSKYHFNFGDTQVSLFGGFAIKNNKFPYQEAAGFLKDRLEGNSVAMFSLDSLAFWGIAPIFEFYLRNSDGNHGREVHAFTPLNVDTETSLYSYLDDLNVRFIVIPKVDYERFGILLSETYTEADLNNLERITNLVSSSELFVQEAEFYSGTNGLLIFRVK